jgi:hypothetical protein
VQGFALNAADTSATSADALMRGFAEIPPNTAAGVRLSLELTAMELECVEHAELGRLLLRPKVLAREEEGQQNGRDPQRRRCR